MAFSTTATQTIHSITSSFQSGWRPNDSSSIHPSLSFYGTPPSCVVVYLTTVPSHLVILKQHTSGSTDVSTRSDIVSAKLRCPSHYMVGQHTIIQPICCETTYIGCVFPADRL